MSQPANQVIMPERVQNPFESYFENHPLLSCPAAIVVLTGKIALSILGAERVEAILGKKWTFSVQEASIGQSLTCSVLFFGWCILGWYKSAEKKDWNTLIENIRTLEAQNPQNLEALLNAREIAAKKGHIESMIAVGRTYCHLKRPNKGKEWLEKAATANHPIAMFELYQLLRGSQDETTAKKAFDWLQKAANLFHMDSMLRLSNIYKIGWIIHKNQEAPVTIASKDIVRATFWENQTSIPYSAPPAIALLIPGRRRSLSAPPNPSRPTPPASVSASTPQAAPPSYDELSVPPARPSSTQPLSQSMLMPVGTISDVTQKEFTARQKNGSRSSLSSGSQETLLSRLRSRGLKQKEQSD